MGYGIDLGSTSLKAVRVQRTLRGFRVVGAGRRRFERPEDPNEARLVTARALRELLGGAGGVGVVGLSGRDINLQVVLQPRMKPANYRAMMGYELDQRRGEEGDLYADYCTLRDPDPYFPNYLAMVGLAKKAYIDERIGVPAGAGLDLRDAIPTVFAVFTAYRNAYGPENGTVMLVDIGADSTDLALVRGGRLIFCRNLSVGSRVFDAAIRNMSNLTDSEAEERKVLHGNLGPPSGEEDPREEETRPPIRTAVVQLTGAIAASINLARNQLSDRELVVDKVYVSGGGARLRGLPEYLQSAMKMPVEPLNPFRNVDLGPMKSHEGFAELPTDMAAPLGLAQISTETRSGTVLSILPDAIKKRRNFYRGPVFLIAAGILLAIVVAAASGVAFVRRTQAEAALRDFQQKNRGLNDRIQKLNESERSLAELIAKRRAIESQVAPGRTLIEAMSKLRRVLPEGVHVKEVLFRDLGRERAQRTPPQRIVFTVPGRGILEGVIPSRKVSEIREEGDIKVRLDGATEESFPPDALAGRIVVAAPWLGVTIRGEIDENIKGGPSPVLEEIKFQLQDPSRGVAADLSYEGSSKPGWQDFSITLSAD